jgi:hypothetical protein
LSTAPQAVWVPNSGEIILLNFTPHSGSAGFNPFQITNKTSKGESYINVNQVSTFDWVARQAKPHPWGTVSKPILQNAKEMLNAVLGLG